MAEIDSVRHKRGLANTAPTLSDGEIGIVEDLGNERLIFGTVNGNINVPSQSDLNTMTTSINSAISTANESLTNSNQAIVNSNNAIDKTTANENQIANIIAHNGDGTKDSEVVDGQIDSNGHVYGSLGDHIRNLDTIFDTLRSKITFTATFDNTSIIPISVNGIDLTKCNFDIRCNGVILEDDNYTIDTTNRNINLTDWSINTGDKIVYRIYFSGVF